MNCSMPGFPVLHYLPEFAQTHVHWVRDAIQPSCPLLPPFSSCSQFFPRVFSNESALHIRWPKYWNLNFSISSSNEYSGLISIRPLQSKGLSRVFFSTTVQKHQLFSAFFMVQLSHPYMTTGKTIALTIWNFTSKVMSLLFFCLFVCFCVCLCFLIHCLGLS